SGESLPRLVPRRGGWDAGASNPTNVVTARCDRRDNESRTAGRSCAPRVDTSTNRFRSHWPPRRATAAFPTALVAAPLISMDDLAPVAQRDRKLQPYGRQRSIAEHSADRRPPGARLPPARDRPSTGRSPAHVVARVAS